ncbi:hypothetical protein NW757_003119 [Fusarium falciforme]|nr:hypothetical protein NW757_003119 [Fusarium falciforme]
MTKFGSSSYKSPLGKIGPDYVELESIASRANSIDEAVPPNPQYTGKINPLDEQLRLWRAIRRFPKVAAYCLIMNIAVVGLGYTLVINAAILGNNSFMQDFGTKYKGKWIIPQPYTSLWTAFVPIGGVIGALLGGWLQGRLGRKFTFMTGSLFYAVGASVVFSSSLPEARDMKRIILTVGVAVQGLAVALLQTVTNTYLSEVTPNSLRGPAMAMIPTFTLLGQLLGSMVVFLVGDIKGSRAYQIPFGSQWIFAAIAFLLSLITPESPIHHLRKGNHDKAMRAARRLYAPKVPEHTALKVFHVILAEEAALGKATYIACFRGVNRRRTLIVLLASAIPAMFGLDLLSNTPYFLNTIGIEEPTNMLFLIGGIVAGMLANAAGIFVLSRRGMRIMTLVTMSLAAVFWAVMGVSGFWGGEIPAYVAAGVLMSVIIVCGLGAWPASYAYIGQTSSMQVRALTQGLVGVLSQGLSAIMNAILPILYNPDSGNMGGKLGFVYTGLCLIAVVLAWLFLPELKGRSVVEVDRMFEMRLSTRNFAKFKLDTYEPRRGEAA